MFTSNIYTAESIIGHKFCPDTDQYVLKIKWRGFSEAESTWESFVRMHDEMKVYVERYVNSLPAGDEKTRMLQIIEDNNDN
jgi:hypothetical protein